MTVQRGELSLLVYKVNTTYLNSNLGAFIHFLKKICVASCIIPSHKREWTEQNCFRPRSFLRNQTFKGPKIQGCRHVGKLADRRKRVGTNPSQLSCANANRVRAESCGGSSHRGLLKVRKCSFLYLRAALWLHLCWKVGEDWTLEQSYPRHLELYSMFATPSISTVAALWL